MVYNKKRKSVGTHTLKIPKLSENLFRAQWKYFIAFIKYYIQYIYVLYIFTETTAALRRFVDLLGGMDMINKTENNMYEHNICVHQHTHKQIRTKIVCTVVLLKKIPNGFFFHTYSASSRKHFAKIDPHGFTKKQ